MEHNENYNVYVSDMVVRYTGSIISLFILSNISYVSVSMMLKLVKKYDAAFQTFRYFCEFVKINDFKLIKYKVAKSLRIFLINLHKLFT